MSIFVSLLGVFSIIILAIFARSWNLFDDRQTEGFENFVFKIALPAYLFRFLFNADLETMWQLDYLYAYLASFLVSASLVFGLAKIKGLLATRSLMRSLLAAYSNTAFYSVSLLNILFADPSAAILSNLIQVILIQSLALAFFSYKTHNQEPLRRRLKSVLLSPAILMPLAGAGFNYFNVELTDLILLPIKHLADSFSSLALFSFGLSFAAIKPKSFKIKLEPSLLLLVKNFFHPCIAGCIGYYWFDLKGYWLYSLVLVAGAPTAIIVYLIAKRFNCDESLAKVVVATSIIASLAIILVFSCFMDLSYILQIQD